MRRLALALLALVAMALLAPTAPAARAQTMNMIRVIHASPDAPAVDVFVNGQAVATSVPFFTASGYLPLADGTYQVAISPAGKGTDYSVLVGDLEVSGGYTGTLVATNTLSNIEAVLYKDDLSGVAGGNARVNVMHLSPDAPAVDIKLAGTSSAVFSGVAFKQRGTVEVPAGSYAFDISPAGSADVVFTTPSLRFESGWIYTLAATGELGKGGFWVQSRVDQIPAPIMAQGLSADSFGSFTSR
ncbi:DUF4397 domain-containing protein [Oscillochloris sp. ZM17-4]|uniref:DUF4397 domain-containing protein n=1 Tax=Oscillochloris sp. ZM17-4 TaxID=2866714 RepID=UPI001C734FB4|nr:DUF4397 domain-containing protein [Oscillochloris sp. ZM17-4]MBX0329482.1 DUF4397 domain-containing protein [Oscillochloris sp. ZM17-4]